MIVLGIDPGIHTGWAICHDGQIVESGVQVFDLGRGESPGMRFLRFRRWLREVCPVDRKAVILAYERAHHRGGAATEIGVGFCTRIQEFAAEANCETLPVHTATLKKWATGRGRADKAAMVQRAYEAIEAVPFAPARKILTDDEADAILVALWAWAEAEGTR